MPSKYSLDSAKGDIWPLPALSKEMNRKDRHKILKNDFASYYSFAAFGSGRSVHEQRKKNAAFIMRRFLVYLVLLLSQNDLRAAVLRFANAVRCRDQQVVLSNTPFRDVLSRDAVFSDLFLDRSGAAFG